MRGILPPVIVALLLAGCLSDDKLKTPDGYLPEDLGDGWLIASPEEAGIPRGVLESLYDHFYSERELPGARGLLVVRDGRLVAEGYAHGIADRDRLHYVQSITKSVTSMLFGVLSDDGVFPDVDERLGALLPPATFTGDPRTRDITLHHLLTMTSGIDLSNHQFAVELLMKRPRNQDRVILARPLYADPGASFRYRDADPQLLSYAVLARTGRDLQALADERLFEPSGINERFWERNADGVTLGAHALWLRPRDLAGIGQLALDRGAWNGVQFISTWWMHASTSTHVDATGHQHGYGYYWWTVPELGAYYALGHGGQFVFVAPEKRLVVILTAAPDASGRVGLAPADFLALIHALLDGAE